MMSCEKSGSVVGSGFASAVELLLLSSYASVSSPSSERYTGLMYIYICTSKE